MWKLIKFIGALVKILFWLVLMGVLAGIVLLYIAERDIPAPLVRRLSVKLSSEDYLVRIGRATYSLKSGLQLHHIKAFPKRLVDSALVSVDEVTMELALDPLLPMQDRLRGVTLTNISMPALPPRHPKTKKNPDPVVIPDLPPFSLTLLNPDILGVKATRLTATVDLNEKRIEVTDVAIQWPDKAFTMEVAGFVTVDFVQRLVNGYAKGQALPHNIVPLLSALHALAALHQIDCFAKIERPVNADVTFGVNIDTRDIALALNLDVGPHTYRDVPMKYAKGPLSVYDTNNLTTAVVGPLQSESSTGPFAGTLVYRQENNSLELDASAAMDQTQLMNIINILNKGELKPVRCNTPLRVTAKGLLALDSTSTATNTLTGKVAFSNGTLFNLHVADMSGDLSIKGFTARFDNVAGATPNGGKLSGDIEFFFPAYAATSTLFTTHVSVSDTDLSELKRAFNVTNVRVGQVSGSLTLSGHASNRTIPTLSGEGKVNIRDGLLHRMPLFAGFTDYLARTIPGISALVNQSSGSMDFSITNGVLRTENLLIEGDLFSIQGKGSYNLDNDALDFGIRANLFKQKTIAGRITRFVTLPFTRLLLEFKLFGTLDEPKWSYANILEKITDSLSGQPDQPSPADPSKPPPERVQP